MSGEEEQRWDKREDLHSIFASVCHSVCVSLISQDTCLKAGKCVCSWRRRGVSTTTQSWQNRGTSLWKMSFDVLLMDSLEGIMGEMQTQADTERRHFRHQWSFALSLRYPYLLCFWASSIKYESLRQKEGEWIGRERRPQRAPLYAFEEPLRQGVSTNACAMHI